MRHKLSSSRKRKRKNLGPVMIPKEVEAPPLSEMRDRIPGDDGGEDDFGGSSSSSSGGNNEIEIDAELSKIRKMKLERLMSPVMQDHRLGRKVRRLGALSEEAESRRAGAFAAKTWDLGRRNCYGSDYECSEYSSPGRGVEDCFIAAHVKELIRFCGISDAYVHMMEVGGPLQYMEKMHGAGKYQNVVNGARVNEIIRGHMGKLRDMVSTESQERAVVFELRANGIMTH